MSIIYLIVAFILNGTANVLLKLGAKKGLVLHGFSLQTISANALFLLGFICFGLNALFYFLALRTLPITVAYPIMVGMSLLIINTFAYVSLGETITTMQMVGYALLIVAITMIFYFAPHTN
ncbi:MAG: hypothetical protein RL094_245 [Candidatus Parcubacteria bacterium]|jgi:small multidrug resistance pump